MTIEPAIRDAFAPSGILRASINFGNPILAHRDAKTGEPAGISIDLARALAQQLGVPLEMRTVDAAGKSVQAVAEDRADVGFFAVDPLRGEHIAFTAPYVLIEGYYLVRDASPIHDNDAVDRPGIRVAVGTGSAYDLYLTRTLKHAEIVRGSTSPEVVHTFLRDGLEVAAGVKQQLEADAQRLGGLRLLGQRFMVIEQAMGVAKTRGEQAAAWLDGFVAKQIASGFVAAAVRRHRIVGVAVPA
jgi:polar amino acid transport system substrate-binding protein